MLLAVACSIALGPMVTFETRGMVVSKLLPELSRIVSAKLESRGLEDVALIVSLRNQPFEKVKGWLAEACDAEWSQEKDKLVLVRSAGRRQIAARTEALWRGQQFKRWIEKNLPDQAWSDSQIAEVIAANTKRADEDAEMYVQDVKPTQPVFMQSLRARTPAHVLLGRLLRSVSAEYLGAFPVNCQVITTTQPNPYERPIPVKTDALTADWMSLARRYAARMDTAPRQNGAVTHRTQEAWLQAYQGQTPHLFVLYSREYGAAALSVRLYVCDGTRVLDTAKVELPLEPTESRPRETPPPKWDLQICTLTQQILARRSQQSQYIVRTMVEPGVIATLPAAFNTFAAPPLDAAVRHPTLVEPHSIGTADAVLGIARTRKKDVIAHVPDSAIAGISTALGASGLNAIWENPMNFAINIEEGEILLIRPNFFGRADRYRIRRAALEKWLNTFGPSNLPSLEDHLAYVKLAPESDFYNNLDHFYSALLTPVSSGSTFLISHSRNL